MIPIKDISGGEIWVYVPNLVAILFPNRFSTEKNFDGNCTVVMGAMMIKVTEAQAREFLEKIKSREQDELMQKNEKPN